MVKSLHCLIMAETGGGSDYRYGDGEYV